MKGNIGRANKAMEAEKMAQSQLHTTGYAESPEVYNPQTASDKIEYKINTFHTKLEQLHRLKQRLSDSQAEQIIREVKDELEYI